MFKFAPYCAKQVQNGRKCLRSVIFSIGVMIANECNWSQIPLNSNWALLERKFMYMCANFALRFALRCSVHLPVWQSLSNSNNKQKKFCNFPNFSKIKKLCIYRKFLLGMDEQLAPYQNSLMFTFSSCAGCSQVSLFNSLIIQVSKYTSYPIDPCNRHDVIHF